MSLSGRDDTVVVDTTGWRGEHQARGALPRTLLKSPSPLPHTGTAPAPSPNSRMTPTTATVSTAGGEERYGTRNATAMKTEAKGPEAVRGTSADPRD